MINEKDLVTGAKYDGFVWANGRQRGVATLRWNGASFESVDGDMPYYVMSYFSLEKGNGFEPNLGG